MPKTATPSQAPDATVLDALSLLTGVADDLVLASVRDTHAALARRVHGAVRRGAGRAGMPAEVLHRGVAGGVYAAIALSLRGAGVGLDKLAATGAGPRLDDGPRGRFVVSAVNGLIGDELLRERPRLAIPMAVRRAGRDVEPSGAALAAAFPQATGQVVVFLHGLCENEAYWNLHRDRTGTTYAEALGERGWTPVFLRANTGLPVKENGVALAALMRRLMEEWPVEVTRIALVGHSMGGLILRSAAAVLSDTDRPLWTDLVSDVVTLGTPHFGAPIAWGIGHGSRLLGHLPETSAIGRVLDRRSEGVRDLVDGVGFDVPPLPHGRYHLVSATLTRSPRHPVGNVVGDLLVRPRSAAGKDRRGRRLFPDADALHVGRTDHFGLLNHPKVLSALLDWLC